MTDAQGALLEIARRLEQAWKKGDSAAWTKEFADDADFIHALGGFFHGSRDIEHGHRTIFDTIYKGTRNRFEVEKVRLKRPDVAVVFIRANLTWYLNGQEQHIQARPTSVAEKCPTGEWKIAGGRLPVSKSAPDDGGRQPLRSAQIRVPRIGARARRVERHKLQRKFDPDLRRSRRELTPPARPALLDTLGEHPLCEPPLVRRVPHFPMLPEDNARHGTLDRVPEHADYTRRCANFGGHAS